ncbi:MAG TPA: hypothetical protein DEB09_02220 [Candidatus Magasanikbacteria bacterium]|nr:hypothetical protein [Candidatus Magasanikbacteria bacterium]
MNKIFVIPGYGVPKNIMTDANYNRYLSFAFNKIYDESNSQEATILFCGGKTDCYPPYQRTEAEEMYKFFISLAKRKFVKAKTKDWQYIKENKSVCRLENFLYARDYIIKNKIKFAEITIFCEFTRRKRAGELIKKIFKGYKVKLEPVDFDLSPNRYLDKKFISKKEIRQMTWALRALEDKNELKKFIQNHKDKLKFFRENDYINNPRVVEEWWKVNSR